MGENLVYAIGGFVVGWILEWIIDCLYFRKNMENSAGELDALQVENKSLRDQLDALRDSSGKKVAELESRLGESKAQVALLAEKEKEISHLKGEAAALLGKVQGATAVAAAAPDGGTDTLKAEIDEYKQALASTKAELSALRKSSGTGSEQAEDDLELIDGIGPVFERKLYAAGIKTFAQLAMLPPDRVREIIAPKNWQKIEPEKWIAEAAEFAKRGS